jgi:hypothetical protein
MRTSASRRCAQQDLTLGAVELASPDKSASTVAVIAASVNGGIDDTDEELGGTAAVSGPRRRR